MENHNLNGKTHYKLPFSIANVSLPGRVPSHVHSHETPIAYLTTTDWTLLADGPHSAVVVGQ